MKKTSKTLLLVREEDNLLLKVLPYNFKDADIKQIPMSYTPFNREDLAKEINQNYDRVIFYNYYDQFYLLLPLINNRVERQWILDLSVSSLSEAHIFQNFLQLLEYQDRGMIQKMASIQYDLYATFKERMSYLVLDYKEEVQEAKEDRIAILNIDYDEKSNFYNELSGIAQCDIPRARVRNAIDLTRNFSKDFLVPIEIEPSLNKIIYGNKMNLDIKMSDIDPLNFIRSMDAGILCIVGNTHILHNSPLEEYLMVPGDDNVDAIIETINRALKEEKTIMKHYHKWREEYTKEAQKSIEEFMK